jgi:hypothetical protein
VYGEGTRAEIESRCAECDSAIEFDLTVTANGADSDHPAARALREWDPIATASDRAEPHMLDGL